jgi:hypothetical protein
VIKSREVAYLKTTQEPVFVLEIVGEVVTVRRPVQSRDGIGHVVNTFALDELESQKESATRRVAEQKMLFGLSTSDSDVAEEAEILPPAKAN